MFESLGCGLYKRFFLVFVHEHRLMSTVLEFFSVRFTAGKNQMMKNRTLIRSCLERAPEARPSREDDIGELEQPTLD